jgi:hypothetical protein
LSISIPKGAIATISIVIMEIIFIINIIIIIIIIIINNNISPYASSLSSSLLGHVDDVEPAQASPLVR